MIEKNNEDSRYIYIFIYTYIYILIYTTLYINKTYIFFKKKYNFDETFNFLLIY